MHGILRRDNIGNVIINPDGYTECIIEGIKYSLFKKNSLAIYIVLYN